MNQHPTNMRFCQEHDIYYNAAIYHCGECFRQQQKDNVKLKASAESWKDSWYEQRDIIGKLSWTVPNIAALRDSPSTFFQRQYHKSQPQEPLIVSFFEMDPFPSLMPMLGDD
jgi:hypothetical protein